MIHRKDIYVQRLGLMPLSEEGGYFGETYRSPETVQVEERDGESRNLFTTIYYLIVPELGGKNYFNSNKSDITHYFHDGWPAKYIFITPEGDIKEVILGRDILKGHVLQLRVPANCLKAAKILVDDAGEYAKFPGEEPFTLISEEMSPGFDYRDRHVPPASEVKAKYPELWLKLEEYCAPGEE